MSREPFPEKVKGLGLLRLLVVPAPSGGSHPGLRPAAAEDSSTDLPNDRHWPRAGMRNLQKTRATTAAGSGGWRHKAVGSCGPVVQNRRAPTWLHGPDRLHQRPRPRCLGRPHRQPFQGVVRLRPLNRNPEGPDNETRAPGRPNPATRHTRRSRESASLPPSNASFPFRPCCWRWRRRIRWS